MHLSNIVDWQRCFDLPRSMILYWMSRLTIYATLQSAIPHACNIRDATRCSLSLMTSNIVIISSCFTFIHAEYLALLITLFRLTLSVFLCLALCLPLSLSFKLSMRLSFHLPKMNPATHPPIHSGGDLVMGLGETRKLRTFWDDSKEKYLGLYILD